jgi:hypothetical protein
MPLPSYPDFATFRLGHAHEPVEVDTSDAVRAASIALVGQASQELVVMSRHLDAVLYDNSEFSTALRDFVLQHRRTRVRVLVKQPEPARREGHRLVTLAQQLSSFMEIRVPSNEFHAFNAAFLVADGIGAIYRSMADRYEATVTFGDRQVAMELLRHFDAMWESAQVDPGLRRMCL